MQGKLSSITALLEDRRRVFLVVVRKAQRRVRVRKPCKWSGGGLWYLIEVV